MREYMYDRSVPRDDGILVVYRDVLEFAFCVLFAECFAKVQADGNIGENVRVRFYNVVYGFLQAIRQWWTYVASTEFV